MEKEKHVVPLLVEKNRISSRQLKKGQLYIVLNLNYVYKVPKNCSPACLDEEEPYLFIEYNKQGEYYVFFDLKNKEIYNLDLDI